MIYYKNTDNTIDTYFNAVTEGIEIQNNIERLFTEMNMTLEIGKIHGFNESNNPYKTQSGTLMQILNWCRDLIIKIGKYIKKMFQDFMYKFKLANIKDNEELLKVGKDKYDSITSESLSRFKYDWMQPSQKLLDILFVTNTNSDISAVFQSAIEMMSYLNLSNNCNNEFKINEASVIKELTRKILGGDPALNVQDFKDRYSNVMLGELTYVTSVPQERKELIATSLKSNKFLSNLENILKNQNIGINEFNKQLDEIEKSIHNNSEQAVENVNKCRTIITSLYNISTYMINITIESITLYQNQCRQLFIKMINYR